MDIIFRKRGEITRPFPRKLEFLTLVRQCLDDARAKYPAFTLDHHDIPVVFFARGNNAGMARWKNVFPHGLVFNLEFNIEAIELDWDHMTQETIPHEVAHIVTRVIYGAHVSAHGREWQRVARSLGCKAGRTHRIPVTKARKHKKHVYIATCGSEILVGSHRHSKIQKRGTTYTVTATRGKITKECYTGRTV